MVATGRSCQPENDIARLKQADQISQIHCQKLSIKSSVKTIFAVTSHVSNVKALYMKRLHIDDAAVFIYLIKKAFGYLINDIKNYCHTRQ